MFPKASDRTIHLEAMVNAPLAEVWRAWTTPEGIKSWFAPGCKVELRPGGAYEMYFDLDEPPGSAVPPLSERGGEGVVLLAIQPGKMLSFTWNAPTEMPTVRPQHTHVVVRFFDAGSDQTKVTLTHDGWGEGAEWDEAYEYFVRAWGKVVLPRLQYRFEVGPVDWKNPPRLD